MKLISSILKMLLPCAAAVTLPATVLAQHYTQTNLVADVTGNAAVQDPSLVNPWGLSRSRQVHGGSPITELGPRRCIQEPGRSSRLMEMAS